MGQPFESRITRGPRAIDEALGRDAVAATGLSGPLADLVHGAAGASPHLSDLIRREAEWLSDALAQAPEDAMTALLAMPVESASRDLRVLKARGALLIALADLAGVWALEDVTGALTAIADRAVQTALEAAIQPLLRRGKLPGQGEDALAEGAGLTVLAMGKMGAGELNYSSDIDLICLFDETRFDPDDYAEARTGFVKAVRTMCQTLSERTADGYVFRTDLRLRPDASVTPVAISMEAAERYYESFGRTWERAAFIKARACAGDKVAGQRFIEALRPFVWRRHLDYAAIQDAQDMRLRIREHKGLHGGPSHLGHDLKLGKGGIREIEFFTQTRQLIAGGRDPDLREAGTVAALRVLAAKDWVPEAEAEQLIADYRAHREAEHRVQMVADQQTHLLPDTEEEFARLAALSGREPGEYGDEIEARLTRVIDLTSGLFQPGQPSDGSEPPADLVERWTAFPALRSQRAGQIFRRIWPRIEAGLSAAAQPEEALSNLESFLRGLPAGVQLFSLFEANPQLLDLVVDIADTAPELGRYLAANSGVFDAVIGGQFFADWPRADGLCSRLSEALSEVSDYEAKLDRARVWQREWHFRVGVHLLRGLIDAETSGRQYADIAGATVQALWPAVVAEFARKHGDPPGRGAAVLAMGSLGAERLNAASDLDLIVIFDGGGAEQSEGSRPLPTRTYFSRLTQALVTALSAPTAQGRLYEVDMRLRPSGRQGPVATSLAAFRTYQTEEAWTWEHLALTRARPLAGETSLLEDIETFRRDLLGRERSSQKTLSEVAEMRQRLAEARPLRHPLDGRTGAGRLQDIELLAQAGTLLAGAPVRGLADQIAAAAKTLNLSVDEVAALHTAAALFWRLQAALRLVYGGNVPPDEIGTGAARFLLQGTGAENVEALRAEIAEAASNAEAIVTARLPD